MTTTPRQAPKTIETPFGYATLKDSRTHETPLVDTVQHNTERRIARIHFDELTVNRKTYKNISLAVTHRYGRLSASPDTYGELTSSAREKVEAYFLDESPGLLHPYMLDLAPADRKASMRARMAYEVLYKLRSIVPHPGALDPDAQLKNDVLDEILEDIVAARDISKPYQSIQLETGGW